MKTSRTIVLALVAASLCCSFAAYGQSSAKPSWLGKIFAGAGGAKKDAPATPPETAKPSTPPTRDPSANAEGPFASALAVAVGKNDKQEIRRLFLQKHPQLKNLDVVTIPEIDEKKMLTVGPEESRIVVGRDIKGSAANGVWKLNGKTIDASKGGKLVLVLQGSSAINGEKFPRTTEQQWKWTPPENAMMQARDVPRPPAAVERYLPGIPNRDEPPACGIIDLDVPPADNQWIRAEDDGRIVEIVLVLGGNFQGANYLDASGENVIIHGTASDDVIGVWGSKSVVIDGGDGHDIITVEKGVSIENSRCAILSGIGNDVITVSGSSCAVDAGLGHDVVNVLGHDYQTDCEIWAGPGRDVVEARWTRRCRIHGGEQEDSLFAKSAEFCIWGDEDSDSIAAETQHSLSRNYHGWIDGGAGNDTVWAWGDNDIAIIGGPGNDVVASTFDPYGLWLKDDEADVYNFSGDARTLSVDDKDVLAR